MNKKSLLVVMASLIMMCVNAQVKSDMAVEVPQQSMNMIKARPQVKMQEMQMREPGTAVARAPQHAEGDVNVWYRRPAGAFPASVVVENGVYAGMYYSPYYTVKPYSYYTFNGFAEGFEDDVPCWWEVGDTIIEGEDLKYRWGVEDADLPIFYVGDYWADKPSKGVVYQPEEGVISPTYNPRILSITSSIEAWGKDLLKSSKTFCYGGRNGTEYYPMTYYSGAKPYGNNEEGWWFGKNAGTNGGALIDGIAQAFEKPEHPYLLNQVVVDCAILEVAADVDMYCKVYKLDEIPAYMDEDEAVLPEEPGELIAMGRATLTPTTANETGDLIFFSLFDEDDGLEFDVMPTIDCPILVVIDGYNAPEMENLTDFSAMISTDNMVDEGFGELAYLKYGVRDEDGNFDHYEWVGLNNFFTSGAMKTGLSIFLSTELPYLTFKHDEEDGYYCFPKWGGLMEKIFGSHTCRSIEFWSYTPSADDAWYITCDGGDVPDWLSIELTDVMENGEFTGLVNATVVAQDATNVHGIHNRNAVVRFEFPGAYLDYTFNQIIQLDVDEQLADKDAVAVGYYDIMGRQQQGMQQGINIIKMSDGTVRKVFRK